MHISAMSEKMAEQFAQFEALLSRGNVFSACATKMTCHTCFLSRSF